jgi:carbon-monoxide dehydrogenase iron sulfur subunit
MEKMLLIDLSRCTGCEACVDVCSGRQGQYRDFNSCIRIRKDEPRTVFIPLTCEQCAQHPCVESCPEAAIVFDPAQGIFKVDEDTCIACGTCIEACPFDGIFMENEKVLKCDLCHGNPRCAEICYPRALEWVPVSQETVMADLRGKIRKLEEMRGTYED